MVLQVSADIGHLANHGNAERLQQLRRSHPRQLQKVRRVEHASGDDYFAPHTNRLRNSPADEGHSNSLAILDQDTGRLRVGPYRQISPPLCRSQIGIRRAPATAALRRALELTYPVLPFTIEILVGGQSSPDCG